MASDKFDVVIIGSGPGGYVAAIRAAQLGLKTAIVEKDKELGGTCLNIGCIPSKALLASSDHYVFAQKEAGKHGIVLENVGLDLAKMLARKDKVVKTMNSGVKMLMKGNKITTFQGLGTVTAPGRVAIKPDEGDAQEIETSNVVIATGSVPVELANMKFDGDVIVSSTEALTFEKAPEKLLVIGGGAIGLELGSVWSRLGSEVIVLEFLPRIALGFDLELANMLQKSLTAQGMAFHLETKVSSVKVENGRAVATATKGEEELKFEADKVLVSVGRRAFAKGVFGENVRVAMDDRGRIKVDEHFKTNVEGIYAIGDVSGPPMLAHKASKEGEVIAEVIAGHKAEKDWAVIPGAIFTDPEIAMAGLTVEEAQAKGLEVSVGKFPFS
ncbi:MAG TPA: dihydrolipoyl dehydrogenase, partial [Chthoniobacterales bacterium]